MLFTEGCRNIVRLAKANVASSNRVTLRLIILITLQESVIASSIVMHTVMTYARHAISLRARIVESRLYGSLFAAARREIVREIKCRNNCMQRGVSAAAPSARVVGT